MRWILLVLMMAIQVLAQATAYDRVRLPGYGVVDFEHVFEAHSREGETLNDFVVRVSAQLRAYTDETKFEACGVIGHKNGQYSVRVNSNRAYMFCANDEKDLVEGFVFTGDTLHSHPRSFAFRQNKNDVVFMGARSILSNHGRAGRNAGFSDEDYESGPGFLVDWKGGVYYQHGRGTSVEIGSIHSGGIAP